MSECVVRLNKVDELCELVMAKAAEDKNSLYGLREFLDINVEAENISADTADAFFALQKGRVVNHIDRMLGAFQACFNAADEELPALFVECKSVIDKFEVQFF